MIPRNKEVTEIEFMDIALEIEADSVLIDGLDVLEQSYNSDLISKERLLEKYLGEVITVRNAELDEEVKIRLLAISENVIGELVDTGDIIIDPVGQLVLPALPSGLLTKPALTWKITAVEQDTEVKVSYLTQGLEWQASYVAEISGSQLALMGRVQLTNRSGIDFLESRLKLTAGKVNRYMDAHPINTRAGLFANSEKLDSFFEEHSFADHHSYTIDRPVSILHAQKKQIGFLKIREAAFRKLYKVEADSKQAKVIMEFDNTTTNNLGIPLPKGVLKVYEKDHDGEIEFIGENVIRHTAAKQKVSLLIGEAFDIVSKSKEKKRDKHGNFEYVTYVYKLQNHKSEYVRIEVNHHIPDRIWQMESSTHDYELKQSDELEFRVHIPANKIVEVEFTYKVDRTADNRHR